MNRALMLATTCALGLLLTACGDNSAPKPAAATPETTVAAPQNDEGTKGETAAPSSTEAAPAPAETPAQ